MILIRKKIGSEVKKGKEAFRRGSYGILHRMVGLGWDCCICEWILYLIMKIWWNILSPNINFYFLLEIFGIWVISSRRLMPIKNCRGLSLNCLRSSPSCDLNFYRIYKPFFSTVHRQPVCRSYVIKLRKWCPKKIVILRLKLRFFWVLKMIIF